MKKSFLVLAAIIMVCLLAPGAHAQSVDDEYTGNTSDLGSADMYARDHGVLGNADLVSGRDTSNLGSVPNPNCCNFARAYNGAHGENNARAYNGARPFNGAYAFQPALH